MPRLRDARNAPRISPIFLGLLAVTIGGGALMLLGGDLVITPQGTFGFEGSVVAGTAGIVMLVLAGWAVSLCLHEFSHALVADRCGDHSVRAMGYLTLDIRRYANVGLTFVLPLLFLLIGGIPLPGGAVWINRGALGRGAQTGVSLAGPLANLVLAVLIALAVAFIPIPLGLAAGLSFLALIQAIAFVLNILPIPGLDGWGAIEPYLSYSTRAAAARFAPYAPLALLVLLILPIGVGPALLSIATTVFGAAGGSPGLVGAGQSLFFFWQR